LICSKIADASIEGHNLAEERLRAEAEQQQEKEEEEPEVQAPEERAAEGPEVIVVSKKQEAPAQEPSEPAEAASE
jgi:hypothetical protein